MQLNVTDFQPLFLNYIEKVK